MLGGLQRSAKELVRGCEKFVPALAYPVLPGPAWVLLSKICILFSRSLYTRFGTVALWEATQRVGGWAGGRVPISGSQCGGGGVGDVAFCRRAEIALRSARNLVGNFV